MIKRISQRFLSNCRETSKPSIFCIRTSTQACYFYSSKALETPNKTERYLTKNELPEKLPTQKSLRSITNDNENIVLVKNLSKDWDEATIKNILKLEDESEITKITFIKDRLGLPTGKVLITLKDREVAEKYIKKYDNDWVQNEDTVQKLQVRFFELKKNKEREVFKKNLKEVCVFNLNFTCKYDDLLSFAKYFGAVERLRLPVKMDGKNKGYAFVTFLSADDAANFVMEADEMDFMDRKVRYKILLLICICLSLYRIKFAADAKERAEGDMKRKSDDLISRYIDNIMQIS